MDAARARSSPTGSAKIVAEMLERRIKDPRLGFVTVTEARLTTDLREAKVFYTVFGTTEEQADTAAALASATGIIRSEVGRQIGLRHTPSLEFVADVLPDTRPADRGRWSRPARQADEELARSRVGAECGRRPRPVPKPAETKTTGRGRGRRPRGRRRVAQRGSAAANAHDRRQRPGHRGQARRHDLARRGRRGSAGWPAPGGSGTRARWTRWRPACSCVGVEKATRLLGHLALTEKNYDATIRLGQSHQHRRRRGRGHRRPRRPPTSTAEALEARRSPSSPATSRRCRPAVSAIKVDGQRAYQLTRAGRRAGTGRPAGHRLRVHGHRHPPGWRPARHRRDVRCSSGTYIRALARDLGAALGTGGHLTALRRTPVGAYGLAPGSHPGAAGGALRGSSRWPQAAAAAFPRRDLTADEARRLAHGAPPARPADTAGRPRRGRPTCRRGHPAAGAPRRTATAVPGTPTAAFGPDGSLVALLTEQDGQARPLVVFA